MDSEFIFENTFKIFAELLGAKWLRFVTNRVFQKQGGDPPGLKPCKKNPHNQKADRRRS